MKHWQKTRKEQQEQDSGVVGLVVIGAFIILLAFMAFNAYSETVEIYQFATPTPIPAMELVDASTEIFCIPDPVYLIVDGSSTEYLSINTDQVLTIYMDYLDENMTNGETRYWDFDQSGRLSIKRDAEGDLIVELKLDPENGEIERLKAENAALKKKLQQSNVTDILDRLDKIEADLEKCIKVESWSESPGVWWDENVPLQFDGNLIPCGK